MRTWLLVVSRNLTATVEATAITLEPIPEPVQNTEEVRPPAKREAAPAAENAATSVGGGTVATAEAEAATRDSVAAGAARLGKYQQQNLM
jgi:hypothetical protein